MITATLETVGKTDDGLVWFSIIYSDGVIKTRKSYRRQSVDDEIIKATARSEVAGLTAAEASKSKISITPGSAIDLTPPVVAKPAPVDAALVKFQSDYGKLLQMQRGVAAGLIAPDNTVLTDLRASVRLQFKPQYMEFL